MENLVSTPRDNLIVLIDLANSLLRTDMTHDRRYPFLESIHEIIKEEMIQAEPDYLHWLNALSRILYALIQRRYYNPPTHIAVKNTLAFFVHVCEHGIVDLEWQEEHRGDMFRKERREAVRPHNQDWRHGI